MNVIRPTGTPKPSPWLSPAILSDNGFLHISGTCGQAESGEFVAGTVQDRTTQALKNIEATLKAAGMGMEDLVATTIYLSAYTRDFDDMNKAYVAAFPTGKPMPTRTCIGVAALPKGTDVEITCVAFKKADAKL
ncbi:hypothetical protein JCM10207_002720 [Rhodosporidiobolus poonsookiae]